MSIMISTDAKNFSKSNQKHKQMQENNEETTEKSAQIEAKKIYIENLVIKLLKIATLVALIILYNNLFIKYQIGMQLKNEIKSYERARAREMALEVILESDQVNETDGGKLNDTLTRHLRSRRKKRAIRALDGLGDDEDDDEFDAELNAKLDVHLKNQLAGGESPDRWLLDYLTGNANLVSKSDSSQDFNHSENINNSNNNNNKSKDQLAEGKLFIKTRPSCICPPGESPFLITFHICIHNQDLNIINRPTDRTSLILSNSKTN